MRKKVFEGVKNGGYGVLMLFCIANNLLNILVLSVGRIKTHAKRHTRPPISISHVFINRKGIFVFLYNYYSSFIYRGSIRAFLVRFDINMFLINKLKIVHWEI